MSSRLKIIPVIIVISFLVSSVIDCHSNQQVFTARPQRTVPLDSVKDEARSSRLPDPVDFTVEFEVPGMDSCQVRVELHNSGTRLERVLLEGVLAPGKQTIRWPRATKTGSILLYGHYYYQFDICGKVTTRSFVFRPQFADPSLRR
ncbi:exported hypothetical protein [Candidatus Zixiibacteriota bacterium]|nr:exported hypothetical protein [candidate division Zixibacteria bacterium]